MGYHLYKVRQDPNDDKACPEFYSTEGHEHPTQKLQNHQDRSNLQMWKWTLYCIDKCVIEIPLHGNHCQCEDDTREVGDILRSGCGLFHDDNNCCICHCSLPLQTSAEHDSISILYAMAQDHVVLQRVLKRTRWQQWPPVKRSVKNRRATKRGTTPLQHPKENPRIHCHCLNMTNLHTNAKGYDGSQQFLSNWKESCLYLIENRPQSEVVINDGRWRWWWRQWGW